MSDSRNSIPEEEPLGGFYDEEEEKVRLSKDFARDKKRWYLDLKDNIIEYYKDVIEQMKNKSKWESSSSERIKNRSNKNNI